LHCLSEAAKSLTPEVGGQQSKSLKPLTTFRFMRLSISFLAFLLAASTAFGQAPDSLGTFQNPLIVTNPDSISHFVGRVISLQGPVVSVKKTQGKDGAMAFLDIFKAYPHNPISVTIYREALAFFEPVEQYSQKNIRVKGKVNSYKDKAGNNRYSITLRKPEQIEILD
jgi:hypothetical protein